MKRQLSSAAVVLLLPVLVQACTYLPTYATDSGNLASLLGDWSVEADVKAGNGYGAPAGRYTWTEEYDWRPGKVLVQMIRSGQGPGTQVRHDVLFGYSVTTKQYSVIFSDLVNGASASGTGTNEGNTWTFVNIGYLGAGKYVHDRCTMNVVPNTSFTVRCDTSPDGRTWSTAYEAKGTHTDD